MACRAIQYTTKDTRRLLSHAVYNIWKCLLFSVTHRFMFYYLCKTIQRPCVSLGYLSLKVNLTENKNNSVNWRHFEDQMSRRHRWTRKTTLVRSGKLSDHEHGILIVISLKCTHNLPWRYRKDAPLLCLTILKKKHRMLLYLHHYVIPCGELTL